MIRFKLIRQPYSTIRQPFFSIIFLTSLFFLPRLCLADDRTPIRISVLKFGTVNWTLETIKNSQLDKKNGFELIIQPLASTQASKIALQAKAADIIVSDWTWVARQRGVSSDYLFAPYSSSAGALIVSKNSPIKSITDLVGMKLGIAGGALDKNWLLLHALATNDGIDLDKDVEKVFGAPPLLNNLIQQGKLDAIINFWHYSARLKAKGFREILSTHDSIHRLGVKQTVPVLGYVFRESWGNKNATALDKFLTASRQASNLLCTSDHHWEAILPLTRTDDAITQQLLRASYCEGRITNFTTEDKQAISDIYTILATTGGAKLVGSVKQLDPALFWNKNCH